MPDYEDLILQRQEGLKYAENCDCECEYCDYSYKVYPNGFDDPYYGCIYDDFFK